MPFVSELITAFELQQDAARALKMEAYMKQHFSFYGDMRLRGEVEAGLRELGFDVQLPSCDAHLCCGSAGTYSVLQPALSKQLRDQKLQTLAPLHADTIVSANIGCIQHLQSGTRTPVRHWIEVLDQALA